MSNRICQDPLENFFSQQRQRGRANENPNMNEFLKDTQALKSNQLYMYFHTWELAGEALLIK